MSSPTIAKATRVDRAVERLEAAVQRLESAADRPVSAGSQDDRVAALESEVQRLHALNADAAARVDHAIERLERLVGPGGAT